MFSLMKRFMADMHTSFNFCDHACVVLENSLQLQMGLPRAASSFCLPLSVAILYFT